MSEGEPKQVQPAKKQGAASAPMINQSTSKISEATNPPSCEVVSAPKISAVIICKASPESFGEKLLYASPSLLVSLCALVLSGLSYKYLKAKDRNARTHSVNDDYWLRKVISPVTIEKFVPRVTKIIAKLPDNTATASEVTSFFRSQQNRLLGLRQEFSALHMLDASLSDAVGQDLESIEDRLSLYCHALELHLTNNLQMPDKADCIDSLVEARNRLLKKVREYQESLPLA